MIHLTARRRAVFILSFLSIICGCGSIFLRGNKSADSLQSTTARSDLSWLHYVPEHITDRSTRNLNSELRRDAGRANIALGFDIERPEVLDVGVYGKIGNATVFVAREADIGTFDRLYWPMVQVLSKKYACFIKNKSQRGNTLRFACTDRRVIIMQRNLSGGFAKFSGRQYDLAGRELLVKRRAVASIP
jgi:hypothetical protein